MNKMSQRLYGTPDSENLRPSPVEVWECDIEWRLDGDDAGPWTIDEYTVRDPLDAFPLTTEIIEWVVDYAVYNDFLDMDPFNDADLTVDRDVFAAAEALRNAVAAKVVRPMAERLVATHELTLVDGVPHFDGKPLYSRAALIGGDQ